MSNRRFPIRVGARSRLLLRIVFGVADGSAWADVGDGRVVVRFGRFGFETTISNCRHWQIEGPFRWITAIGVRMSVRQRDISFAGSPHGGVRVDLVTPVHYGPFRVPAFWVGADDLEAFGAALRAEGVPGEDLRRR